MVGPCVGALNRVDLIVFFSPLKISHFPFNNTESCPDTSRTDMPRSPTSSLRLKGKDNFSRAWVQHQGVFNFRHHHTIAVTMVMLLEPKDYGHILKSREFI